MNAEQVTEKILSDAGAEAKKITEAAAEAASQENRKLQRELAEFEGRTRELAEKAAVDKKLRMLAKARMEIARDILAEKRVILDDVFATASECLRDMPAEEYRELMGKLLGKAVESGDEEVIVDVDDSRLDQSFIDDLNRRLEGESKGNLKLSAGKEDLGGGGFILSSGRIKINVSLPVLVGQLREKLETKLAKELFE